MDIQTSSPEHTYDEAIASRIVQSSEEPQQRIEMTRTQIREKIQHVLFFVDNNIENPTINLGFKIGELTAQEKIIFADEIGQISDGIGLRHERILKLLGIPRVEYNEWQNADNIREKQGPKKKCR